MSLSVVRCMGRFERRDVHQIDEGLLNFGSFAIGLGKVANISASKCGVGII